MDMQDAAAKEFRRGRVRAGMWAFAVWIVGGPVCSALGLPPLLATIIFGVVAGIVFLFKLHGSVDTENVLRDSGSVPPVLDTNPPKTPEVGSTQSVGISELDYFLSTDFDPYLRGAPWLSNAESRATLDWNLHVPARPTRKVLSEDGRSYLDVSDYGAALVPPSDEAMEIFARMNQEERLNLHDLLSSLQLRAETISKTPGILLHPSARASLWGQALARIGDHYHEVGNRERTLFFTGSAWNLSRYPIFGVQLALLLLTIGDVDGAKLLLESYLVEYPTSRQNSFLIVNPFITDTQLQYLSARVRERLAAIETSQRINAG